MIRIRNLSRGYGTGENKIEAVKDLSLEVKKGELFGFLGPNGAGKTTTIKVLVGLLKADEGSVFINDIKYCKTESFSKIYDRICTGRTGLVRKDDWYEVFFIYC